MNNDIVDRLRYVCSCESQGVCTWCDGADEIVRLRARVTELEAERDAAVMNDDMANDRAIADLTAERALADQLAEALCSTRSAHDSWCPGDAPTGIDAQVWPDGCPFCAALAAHEAARRKTP